MKRKEEITKLLIVVDMVNGFIKEGKMIVNKNIMVLKYIDFKVYKYIRKKQFIC